MNKIEIKEKIHGAAGIYRSGRPLYENFDGTGMTDSTVFRIASVTKSFTSAAIMRLVETGMLKLDMHLDEFIHGIPNGDRISIHNLLTQDSGIPDFIKTEKFKEESQKNKTREELVDNIRELEPAFDPGEKWEYSNSNYILLGYILEKVSSMSYDEFLRIEFLDRLGMENTGLDDGSRKIMNLVKGYVRKENGLEEAQGIHMSQPFSTGGMYSCLKDLSIWADALMNERAVSSVSLEMMIKKHSFIGEDVHYGYGLHVLNRMVEGGFVREVSHSGEIPGFNSYFCFYPEKDTSFVLLSNVESEELDNTIKAYRHQTLKSFEKLG